MISTLRSAYAAIRAVTPHHVSSRSPNRSKRAPLRAALAVLLGGVGSIAFAQTAHFSGAQTTLTSGSIVPWGVAVDDRGDVFVADNGSGSIEEILAVNGSLPASPVIETLASGFYSPLGVAVDVHGNIYIANAYIGEIQEILAVNGSIPASPTIITLYRGGNIEPFGVGVDGSGNVYFADYNNNAVEELLAVNGSIPASPSVYTLGSGFAGPRGVAVDGSGNVYVADTGNGALKVLLAVGGSIPAVPTIVTLGGGFVCPMGVALDGNADVYVADYCAGSVEEILAVNGSVLASPTVNTLASGITSPASVAVDGSGNVYVGEVGNSSHVLKLSSSGGSFGSVNIGSTSPAISMVFSFDSAGTLGSTAVFTQGATGLDFTDAGTGTCTANTAYTAGETCTVNVIFTPRLPGTRNGAVVLYNSGGSAIASGNLQGIGVGPQIKFLPGAQSAVASFVEPEGVTVDSSGNVYVSNSTSIYEIHAVNGSIPASPTITTLIATGGSYYSVAVDASGNLYTAPYPGNSVIEIEAVNGVIPASPIVVTLSGSFNEPEGVAVDGNGNVYVADTLNKAIKEILAVDGSIPASPTIVTLATAACELSTVAVDTNGNVYFGGCGQSLMQIEAVYGAIPASPTIRTLATNISVDGIAVDGSGNVYVSNNNNNAVQEILAVNGSIPASPTIVTLSESLSGPEGVALDASGNVYVADVLNNRLEKLNFTAPPSLTFANTAYGTISADSPQTVTITNAGNAALNFPIPSTGNNPSIAGNFDLNGSEPSACPIVSSGSSAPSTLAAGASCQFFINFAPTTEGLLGGSLVLTDNNLNAGAPGYASQSIGLSGTGTFILTAAPMALTIAQASSATSTITVSGISGNVTLAASGLFLGLTASFSPNPTTGTSVLTLSAANFVAPGTYSLKLTATSGAQSATAPIVLTVTPGPGFTLDASAPSVSVDQGTSATSSIAVAGVNGFTGSVNLAVSGLPFSVTATFAPNPTAGTAVLTLAAGADAPLGTQNIKITGTSGALTASTILSLTINSPQVTAPPPVNFGAVNIGTASPATPLSFVFVNGGVLGSTAVVTQGATGLDFTDAGTGTCAPNTAYSPGQSCTINVTFTPTLCGTRYGAALVEDIYGDELATGYVQGRGLGPQVNFLPGTESTIANASGGLLSPNGVAVDGSGNVYIADAGTNLIWEATPSAGGYTLNTFSSSSLNQATAVAVDGNGNVYIADTYNNRVLEETPFAEGGNGITVADSANNGIISPVGLAVDGNGNVYFFSSGTLYEELSSAGGFTQTTIPTSGVANPAGIAVDGSGNLYIVDSTKNQVYEEVLSAGSYTQITIPTSGLSLPTGIAVDGNGNLFIADTANNRVLEEKLSGGSYIQSTVSTSPLNWPLGVALDGSGNIYIADNFNTRVLKEDLADAPSLTFASTAVGSTSSDSPQTITVENIGNAALTFPVLSAGNNPSIPAGFTLNSTASSACPLVAAGSQTAGILAAGTSCQLPISFTPAATGALGGSLLLTDNNLNAAAPGYSVQNISLSGAGTQGTPTITWAKPAAIAFGTPLSIAQLNASSTVAGTFSYLPAAGTVLTAGVQTLTVTFTPADTTDYTSATATTTLTVNQATPAITWATSAAITYGTALSGTQLNASSTVEGTFTYLPAAGTVLNAGTQTLTVTFVPTDLTDYVTATATVKLTVKRATLSINWATPAPISYGTALSGTQLDATSTATGTYAYSPAAGAVLGVGSHTLTVTFTPANPANYNSSTTTASVTLTVNKAMPAINWATPAAIIYGTALSATQLDAGSTVAGTFFYSPEAGTVLSAGQQTLQVTFTPANTTDYTTAKASVMLTVNKATPTITWATPAAITYGTALNATQLDASSKVAGSFTYSPAAGTVPAVGQQTLQVTFTPTNTTDYMTAAASVTLTVNPAPTFTLSSSPASLTVAQGGTGKSTITVSGQNGFAGNVSLAATGLPSGVTAAFGTNPATRTSVLTLTASSTAATGTSTVTIKGTSGNLTASSTIALTITCTPTTIVPYIYVNGTWSEESSVTVSSPSTVVDLGPQPSSSGSWSWTGPNGYTSTSRQINSIPLTAGADWYLATYTNATGCKSTETFMITVK